MIDGNAKELLMRGLNVLKLKDCAEKLSSLLLKYVNEIQLFNLKFNLIKAENIEEIIISHILDSLSSWKFFDSAVSELSCCSSSVKIADIGSGAGLPGIPLASLFSVKKSGAQFTLIERMSRRCAMLENVCAMLNLQNTAVLNTELEKLPDAGYAIITCRAFKPLDLNLVHNFQKCLKRNGKIFLYKGKLNKISGETEIIKEANLDFEIIPLEVPFLHRERNLVIIKNNHPV